MACEWACKSPLHEIEMKGRGSPVLWTLFFPKLSSVYGPKRDAPTCHVKDIFLFFHPKLSSVYGPKRDAATCHVKDSPDLNQCLQNERPLPFISISCRGLLPADTPFVDALRKYVKGCKSAANDMSRRVQTLQMHVQALQLSVQACDITVKYSQLLYMFVLG